MTRKDAIDGVTTGFAGTRRAARTGPADEIGGYVGGYGVTFPTGTAPSFP
ncbi:hypothetical protein [Streptosporangium sp. NPDC006007]